MIESDGHGYGTELKSILETIESQNVVDQVELLNRFWDMFIVDALIGNMARHNGNWGFLYNTLSDEVSLAPVYDCGSSLYPQADEIVMNKVLTDENELKIRVYEFPTSAIFYNGKRINYFEFISSNINSECTKALLRICPKINIQKINQLIDEIECLTNLEKAFYKKIIWERKSKIIDYCYNKFIQK